MRTIPKRYVDVRVIQEIPINVSIQEEMLSIEIKTPVIAKETSEIYTGAYEIIPSTKDDVILNTKNKVMANNVLVYEIPYSIVWNGKGNTAYIGE